MIAGKATYAGSPEHKIPHLRNDATPCPPDLEANHRTLTRWLREAIRLGHVGGLIENGFPRYVWYRHAGRIFEGRLTNQATGEYKGYPIDPSDAPREIFSHDV